MIAGWVGVGLLNGVLNGVPGAKIPLIGLGPIDEMDDSVCSVYGR